MKKLFAFGLMAVMFAWSAKPAAAWWPCYPLCGCDKKGSKCCASITIKQYNAFTPICCGSMSCDGCCPINLSGCGAGVCGPGMLGCAMSPAGPMCADPCAGACFAGCDGCGLGHLPATGNPAPAAVPAPTYKAPAPTPTSYYMGNPYMVQPAAYQHMMVQPMMVNPAYPMMPTPPNPIQQNVPYYWNMAR